MTDERIKRASIVEQDLRRAETLPSSWYFDQSVFQQETARLFHGTWQLVAKAADLPASNTYVTAELAGEPLLLTRDHTGTVRGFYNVCRHRAGPVAVGAGQRRALQCAYHGWSYGLDGRLLSAREMDGTENFDPICFGLVPIRTAAWGPLIFVNLDADGPAFADDYGAVINEVAERGFDLGAMQPVERRDYVIECNWKVYVDNYLEGYHIPIVHPGLFQELDYERYEVETFRNYSKQFAPVRPAEGDAERRYGRYDTTPGDEAQALYYWVFPNLMLNIYPDNISTNVILPLGIDRTLTIFEWFATPNTPAEDMEATIQFSDEIQQEDIGICEKVQRGLRSKSYDRGRFSARRENGVHHFHRLLAASLDDPGKD